MSELIYQLKYALAGIISRKSLSGGIIITMGVTLAALFVAASLFYVLVVKPLPYPDQDRLYRVDQIQYDSKNKPNVNAYGYAGLIHLYRNQTVFDAVGLVDYNEEILSSNATQPRVFTSYVTPDFLTTIGAWTERGRLFGNDEALDSYGSAALLSFDAWQRLFGGADDILGRKLQVRGRSYSVVGVMSKAFVEPELAQIGRKTDIYLPWDHNPVGQNQRRSWTDRTNSRVFIGKLKAQYSAAQAEQITTQMLNQQWQINTRSIGFYRGWQIKMSLKSFAQVILGDSKKLAYLLMVCALSLLLIAVVNVANLLLSRAFERKREFAICASVGATNKDIFRAAFTESALLMLCAAFFGLTLAHLANGLMQRYLAGVLPLGNGAGTGAVLLGLGVVAALALAYVFAHISTYVLDFRQLKEALSGSGKGTGNQISKRVRNAFIVSQVALASIIVFVNLSFFVSANRAIDDPDIMITDNLISVRLSLAGDRGPSRDTSRSLMAEIAKKFQYMPIVEGVSLSRSPLDSSFNTWSLVELGSMMRVLPEAKNIDENYLTIAGAKLLDGRLLNAVDTVDRRRVLVINDVLAKRLAPNGSALGKLLSFNASAGANMAFEVVGVVKGMQLPGEHNIPPRIYRPLRSNDSLIIKLKPHQSLSKARIAAIVNEVSRQFAVYDHALVDEQKQDKLFNQYLSAAASIALTLVSLLLSAVGLYGIISYNIALRRTEIGIHLSVGATRRDVILLFLHDLIKPMALAFAIGAMATVFLYGYLEQYMQSVMVQFGFILGLLTFGFMTAICLFGTLRPLFIGFGRNTIDLLKGQD